MNRNQGGRVVLVFWQQQEVSYWSVVHWFGLLVDRVAAAGAAAVAVTRSSWRHLRHLKQKKDLPVCDTKIIMAWN